jgi:hypothetical protein
VAPPGGSIAVGVSPGADVNIAAGIALNEMLGVDTD